MAIDFSFAPEVEDVRLKVRYFLKENVSRARKKPSTA